MTTGLGTDLWVEQNIIRNCLEIVSLTFSFLLRSSVWFYPRSLGHPLFGFWHPDSVRHGLLISGLGLRFDQPWVSHFHEFWDIIVPAHLAGRTGRRFGTGLVSQSHRWMLWLQKTAGSGFASSLGVLARVTLIVSRKFPCTRFPHCSPNAPLNSTYLSMYSLFLSFSILPNPSCPCIYTPKSTCIIYYISPFHVFLLEPSLLLSLSESVDYSVIILKN